MYNAMLPYLILIPGAFFAPVIHEFVKARVSAKLGDPTPNHNGFITLNPFKYFEPIGFILMMFFQMGWGQPVTISPFYYKDKRKGVLLTYITPIVANLFVGVLSFTILSVVNVSPHLRAYIITFGRMNIGLAIFNLIPVHPLAMSKIIKVYVTPETSMKLNHYEKHLQFLLIFMMAFGLVGQLIFPIRELIIRAVY